MAESDLTLKATLALELGVADSDARLPRLISVASAAVTKYLGRRLHYGATITEKVAGYGRQRILLDVAPVLSVASITLGDGTVVPSTEYSIESAEAGVIYRGAGWRSTGYARTGLPPANDLLVGSEAAEITVVYAGGYVTPAQTGTRTLPYDIEEAAVQTAAALYRKGGSDPTIASESLGDYSVSYRLPNSIIGVGAGGLIPDAVIVQLAAYRRPL